MTRAKRILLAVVAILSQSSVACLAEPSDGETRAVVAEFIQANCLDCHSGSEAEAGLTLDQLPFEPRDPDLFRKWVLIYDRLHDGEMPPPDASQPDTERRDQVLAKLGEALESVNLAKQNRLGRVQFRRLSREEYESTLRDLLSLPNLEVSEMLPPDATAHGFDNIGSALNLSYVQMSRYLDAANAALDQAIVVSPRPSLEKKRLEARTNGRFAQVLKKGQEAVPIGDAVGLLRQPNTAQAPWFWSKFEPPMDGYYRVRMKSFGFLWDRGDVLAADRTHAVTFHAVQGSTKRPLGTFDVGRSEQEASTHDFMTFLRQGDQLQIWFETLDDRNRGRQELSEFTAPGVAVEWLEVEGPVIDAWPPTSYQQLFGNLPMEVWTPESGRVEPPLPTITEGVGKRAQRVTAKRNKISLFHVVSENPQDDSRRLLVDFASRAFRRPVNESELEGILALVQSKLETNHCFQEAMRIGFQAILCTPEFLFLQEAAGKLDPYALASRLSYFLWNSMPDAQLLAVAQDGTLTEPAVLREQVDRMLDDPKSQRFVESYCGQWLDLRRITITQPDEQLYPEFDQLLQDSMLDETHAFVGEMLRDDLGVKHLIDSEFVMINGRLAEHYEIPDVEGVSIRKVRIPKESPRGGIVTQASILKVTANGTTTSPVTRGAWMLDRIYGQPASLPPPNVPAIEPDLRGTITIREQLDKHRDIAACASCHRKIDPPGFALESFDVIGGWRDRYRSLGEGDAVDTTYKGGRPVPYKLGLPVDSSGVAPNGKTFKDVEEFREILVTEKEQLARNLAQRLLVYATGAGVEFADRRAIEEILDRSRATDFGLRTLIHAVVQSDAFQSK